MTLEFSSDVNKIGVHATKQHLLQFFFSFLNETTDKDG